MRRVAFHPEADNEVIEAARYYETRSAGLGFSFLIELDSSIEQVVANPEAYQLVSEDVRRKPFRRFLVSFRRHFQIPPRAGYKLSAD
jgi:plasmid stabilization system protein ParE